MAGGSSIMRFWWVANKSGLEWEGWRTPETNEGCWEVKINFYFKRIFTFFFSFSISKDSPLRSSQAKSSWDTHTHTKWNIKDVKVFLYHILRVSMCVWVVGVENETFMLSQFLMPSRSIWANSQLFQPLQLPWPPKLTYNGGTHPSLPWKKIIPKRDPKRTLNFLVFFCK